ncbi:thiamine pyrophosphate-binding protein [Novosphingobium sp.]|jgi:acetolactate synthase-1/2/3 large subunit|uniref:thiamine pyrophosphate-binding protein n=1 Tax=Novosphingobium sp. TaxID=1874826 RepID=UPI0022C7EE78|nr:thiamine pyrophosphate-binding protein [Novosphingobium sp.]MCZ8017380.1 thiamine pyrophosphate-binding protein [Novosphingobium sp.]MCZ8034097.1 thiamine pyrophosphate-binding protein [Novosphingobium sp.]MCZ8051452.1 thiamine pyrophosphate-binding protein [Novosphingobium sp.]MCZ8059798.1 thiamine pyrophosphate-binding protein [Novosphingobium sp.]MCZ8231636.1 thiamine pyrophosphate-binding protein [Novosphingobium sp.]
MSDNSTITGGRLLVDCLIAQGCDRIFTVPGESFLAVLDALHDSPEIETVICRQEGGAAFMACADGTLTGRPGVCFVTRGPGAANASIGAHVAFQDSQPMLLFIGDVDRGMRDREGFQEVDFATMFAPLAKLVLRIDDPRRIPEYIARAWATAMAGRPGPVVIALPEDMLLEQVADRAPRPAVARPAQAVCPDAMGTLMRMIEDACAPVAIVGGAGWHAKAREHFTGFAERIGLPVAGAFRRQDAVPNSSPAWAGNLGYGPNPKLVERIRNADLVLVVGARLGEATTDSYTLITPDHPGQTLVHVHPDPEELGRVYRPDMAICADMTEFAEAADLWDDDIVPFDAGAEAHAEWLDWSNPKTNGHALDMGQVVAAMRAALPDDAIICNGAGNFSGWWHRYWHYNGFPTQLAPTAGAMGFGVPAAVAAARRYPDRTVIALAGDGDFLMNGQELATAVQYGCDMLVVLVDNGAYGTIRMHQEREFPARVSGTTLHNPDFAALARAFGGWAERVETTEQFTAALAEAKARKGVRLLHLVIDVEQLSAGGASVSGLRARAGK